MSSPDLYFLSFRQFLYKGLPLMKTSSCKLSKAQWGNADPDVNDFVEIEPPDTIKWGRVLLVIHGFNVNEKGFETDFNNIVDRVKKLPVKQEHQYTQIVGILWPAEAHLVEYTQAKKNAKELATKDDDYQFRPSLRKILECQEYVDVLVHGLGNYLLFETLNEQAKFSRVPFHMRYIFSLAPAIGNDSVEKIYHKSLETCCTKLFVFFPKKDTVLSVGYKIEEWKTALGYSGAKALEKTPNTYIQIDCSASIDGHSEYWTSADIYTILAKLISLPYVLGQKTYTIKGIQNLPNNLPQPETSPSKWKPFFFVLAILALLGFLYRHSNPKFDN